MATLSGMFNKCSFCLPKLLPIFTFLGSKTQRATGYQCHRFNQMLSEHFRQWCEWHYCLFSEVFRNFVHDMFFLLVVVKWINSELRMPLLDTLVLIERVFSPSVPHPTGTYTKTFTKRTHGPFVQNDIVVEKEWRCSLEDLSPLVVGYQGESS